jgi:hypothetical protein
LDPPEPLLLQRLKLVDEIRSAFLKGIRSVLLRAPPASGKTSLLALVYKALPNSRFIYVSCVRFDATSGTRQELEDYIVECAQKQGYSFTSFDRLLGSVDFLVLDDAQRTFHLINFWEGLLKTSPSRTFVVIAAAAYSLKFHKDTPAQFGLRLDYNNLKLTLDEVNTLVDQWLYCGNDKAVTPLFTEDLRKLIHEISAGHVFLCRAILRSLGRRVKASRVLTVDLIEHVVSSQCIGSEDLERCLQADSTSLTPARSHLLTSVIVNDSTSVGSGASEELQAAKEFLVKMAVLVEESDGSLIFASPLHKLYFSSIFYPGQASLPPSSLHKYILSTISHMKASTLLQTVERVSGGAITEAAYSHAFYQASICCLTPRHKTFVNISRWVKHAADVQGPRGGTGNTGFTLLNTRGVSAIILYFNI